MAEAGKCVRGWVYVIVNAAMQGIVKVGFSTKDPVLRASELSSTGVPHPFRVVFDALVESPRDVEQRAHAVLARHREGKEWFKCDLLDAVRAIRNSASAPRPLLERWHADGLSGVTTVEAALEARDAAWCDGGDLAALPWLCRAAELGDIGSIAELLSMYSHDEQFHDAELARQTAERLHNEARRRAELGDCEAQLWYARCLKDGMGTPSDVYKALVWFGEAGLNGDEQAALRHDRQALLEGGRLLLQHPAFADRRHEGVAWLERSKHPFALTQLARMYELGEGVTRDIDAAIRCREEFGQFSWSKTPPYSNEDELFRLRQLRLELKPSSTQSG